jgi:N-acetylneuraminate synthase
MKLGKTPVGKDHPPFIIAELSGNHNQSLERALGLVDLAAAAGASALKIQTYTPDTMTLDIEAEGFVVREENSLWKSRRLYDLYKEAMTPWEWHGPILRRCQEHGLEFFSTPFDASAVDFLEQLGVSFYKVASFENVDVPLLRKVAATGKPVILSTGMADLDEVKLAVDTLRRHGSGEIILLKCTSAYPAKPEEANLRTIPHMRATFEVEVGLSDHTLGTAVPVTAVSLGATVIEKHFTSARSEGGVDSAFSLEPAEFRQMVNDCRVAWAALGKVNYGTTPGDANSKKYRRSLYVVEDMKAGAEFTAQSFRSIRPGGGLEPKYYDLVLGKRASRDLKKGTPISWDAVDFSN